MCEYMIKTDRRTERQTGRQTTDRRTDTQTHREGRQASRQAGRQTTDRRRHRQTDRQTDRRYTYNTVIVSHASEVGEVVARTYPSELLILGKILVLGEIQKSCDCVAWAEFKIACMRKTECINSLFDTCCKEQFALQL